jgi:valyl-tRNA synthetase
MSDLPKNYDPKAIEAKWYAWWLQTNAFHRDHAHGGTPYTIVIPPPNVTGILHMGHALNNSIQDVLIRWKRMQGYNAVWVPGTDHAGIATQNVVERAEERGQAPPGPRPRKILGARVGVEGAVRQHDHQPAQVARFVLRLGAPALHDGRGLSNAVKEVFIRLYDKDLIYRGKYIINWCPRCQTALSDEESEHRDVKGKLYHIKLCREGKPRRIRHRGHHATGNVPR